MSIFHVTDAITHENHKVIDVQCTRDVTIDENYDISKHRIPEFVGWIRTKNTNVSILRDTSYLPKHQRNNMVFTVWL